MTQTPARKPRPTFTLEVLASQWLNPHLVRLRLGGDGFDAFENRPETDKYVKLLFSDAEGQDVSRTYTVRRVDEQARTLEIDFVIHGDDGLAGPWAAHVTPGEQIRLRGPGGGYRPNPEAGWYLFAGDLSALPAISAALEALSEDAQGVVLLEVDAEDAPVQLDTPAGVDVFWFLNAEHNPDVLAREILALNWQQGHVDVFAHGERESMKLLRRALLEQRGLTREQVSLSGYWARGRTEDRFQAEKREPIGQIFPS